MGDMCITSSHTSTPRGSRKCQPSFITSRTWGSSLRAMPVQEGDEEGSTLDIESLEVFENIAYIMAKHADPENVPDTPDEWLEAFNTFSIYEVLPQLIELWGLNVETQAESKKNIVKLTAR